MHAFICYSVEPAVFLRWSVCDNSDFQVVSENIALLLHKHPFLKGSDYQTIYSAVHAVASGEA